MRDMISVASGFQYSVNIGYDLGSDDKLKNFIPTKSALSLLEEVLLSINPTSSDRARVLIGAYGKGKSHIVLTILSVLMKRDLALFEKLMPRIAENPRLNQLVQNYYESENKILPVVISGSNTSLTQAFLLSLQRLRRSLAGWKTMTSQLTVHLSRFILPLHLEAPSIRSWALMWLTFMRAWRKASSPRVIPASMLCTTSSASFWRPILLTLRLAIQKCYRILRRSAAGAEIFNYISC